MEEAHGYVVGVEEFDGCVADELPAAGSGDGVDAGLIAGDAEAAGGNNFAGGGKAGSGQGGGEAVKIGEAGDEAEEGDGVVGGGVEFDNATGGEVVEAGEGIEIGAVVVDGDLVKGARGL